MDLRPVEAAMSDLILQISNLRPVEVSLLAQVTYLGEV